MGVGLSPGPRGTEPGAGRCAPPAAAVGPRCPGSVCGAGARPAGAWGGAARPPRAGGRAAGKAPSGLRGERGPAARPGPAGALRGVPAGAGGGAGSRPAGGRLGSGRFTAQTLSPPWCGRSPQAPAAGGGCQQTLSALPQSPRPALLRK